MYDGSDKEPKFYLRHKDAFRLDENNIKLGQKLRKITVITYLNPELDGNSKYLGELRLYLADKIIDVVPHMGRTIVFKSENVEHEVRPTMGYQRFAVTTWFHQVFTPKFEVTQSISSAYSIFVGIPSYRDP